MNMQEIGTAVQYRLPVKQFILNNERLGMVRQWQELLHGERYSSSWSEALPDFVKLADAFGAKGILCTDPAKLDDAITEMLEHPGPGHLRLRGREARELLPDDPVRQGAQRDDPRRGRDLRRHRRRRRGPGLRRQAMFKAAIVQHPPVFLDLEASLARAVELVAEAADARRRARGLPRGLAAGLPDLDLAAAPRRGHGARRTTCTARSPPTPSTSAATACARCATSPATAAWSSSPGCNEIDRAASSTLFNSVVVIDADGSIANRHRKLMPTNPERMVWGFGDGSGLRVVETAAGGSAR